MNREIRFTQGLELRFVQGRPRLAGYAAVYGARSIDFGGFVEVIEPGAFTRTLKGSDIRAFVGHDQSRIIGRESNGTLRVEEDSRGLKVEITPPDTQDGRDVVENVKSGLIDSMSFGFRPVDGGSRWDMRAAPAVRYLRDLNLFEVSVVAIPAFPDTSVAIRSMPTGPLTNDLKSLLAAKVAGWGSK